MKFTRKFDFRSDLIFNNLNIKELNLVKEVQEKLRFNKGDKLFYEDGVPTGVFQLIEGKVKKYKTVLDNQEQIIYIYTKNDLFGHHALLSSERYQDTSEALEDITVNFISKENFLMLLDKIPQLKDALLENISHEFGVLANTIAVLAQKSQNIRLSLFLMVLQKRFASKDANSKGVDITREDLANIIGTSRESLSRSLNYLKKEKLITIEKKVIVVLNEELMEYFIKK